MGLRTTWLKSAVSCTSRPTDGTSGAELWRTGGTAATTSFVANIRSGSGGSYPNYISNRNGQLIFSANDGTGVEVWKSDGTASGTSLLKDINVGAGSSSPVHFQNVGGIIYFSAFDTVSGRELWRTDGTTAGTNILKDLMPGSASSLINEVISFNGSLLFFANDGNGQGLFSSDGTSAGTKLVKHTSPNSLNLLSPLFTPFAGSLFFVNKLPDMGLELWKTDGTLSGTVLFKDIDSPYVGSNPIKIAEVKNKVFFIADTNLLGRELWVTDGTTQGTVLVKDIKPGAADSAISSVEVINDVIYFSANDGTSGSELWRSDGTTAGTFQVADINPGIASSSLFDLTNVNGLLYFNANDSTFGGELWISDGTAAGTMMVKDINPGVSWSYPANLVNAAGILMFSANDGTTGKELWRSDGSPNGTVLVKDINPTGASTPVKLSYVGGKVYFQANDGSSGPELWVSDSTTAGTFLLGDLKPGAAGSNPSVTVDVGGSVFFSATDLNGTELWKTNGTLAGTVMVKDIANGVSSSTPTYLTNFGGTLYFAASDIASGTELWMSDGTAVGTTRIKDINPSGDSKIKAMTNIGGQLVFSASDGNAIQTWTSDGTAAGTIPLIANSASTSYPEQPTSYVTINGQLFAMAKEVLRVLDIIDVDLSSGAANRAISIRNTPAGVQVFDQTSSTQLALISKLALANIEQLTVVGSSTADESITVDYQSGGYFSLPKGLAIDAGSSSGDALSVAGTSAQRLTWQTQESPASASFSVIQQNATATSSIKNFETVTTSGFLSATATNLLQAGPPNMFFNNPGTLTLAATTQLSGGTLSTTSLASLAAGNILTGAGSLQGRFAGELGSLILPSGNMAIGSNSSSSGFITRGDLVVDQYSVSLLDANEAVLGSQTTLGNAITAGTLSASNGVLVDFGNNVSGFGSVTTPNSSTKPFIANGTINGTSTAHPITLTGFVKGVGQLTNVNIAGTYSPGFSPAAVTVGDMTYGPTATTIIELSGGTPGTGYDQINHLGTAALGGTLNVQLINSYQANLGDSFTIMTATGGFTGGFASQVLPPAPNGTGWNVVIGTNDIALQLVDLNEVTAVQFGDGNGQHSGVDRVVVTIQSRVDIDPTAFTLIKRGAGGGPVANSFVTTTDANGDTIAILTFSGAFTRAGGALLDGYYQLTIDGSQVRRKGSILKLDGDGDGVAGGDFVRGTKATDNYFAFYGDANGDGQVGVAEFGQFRSTFGKLPSDTGYDWKFDYDGGGVGVADFGQFRTRFGKAIQFV